MNPLYKNNFKSSMKLEDFSNEYWFKPAVARNPAAFEQLTDMACQRRGQDWQVRVGAKHLTLEVKTEGLPLNCFLELGQLTMRDRLFEYGYVQKCEADYLMLGNLPGGFAVVVHRAPFLAHAIDCALTLRNTRKMSLVANVSANRDSVERAGLGIAVPYVSTLASYAGPWALLDTNSTSGAAAAAAFLDNSLFYVKDAAQRAQKRFDLMETGRRTFASLTCLPNRVVGTRFIEKAIEALEAHAPALPNPAVKHRTDELVQWAASGLVTGQAPYASRCQGTYSVAFFGQDGYAGPREIAPSVVATRGSVVALAPAREMASAREMAPA